MRNLSVLLASHATESGEVVTAPVSNELLVSNLIDEASLVQATPIAVEVDKAEAAGDISLQLDDLADRAEAVQAASADMPPEVVQISTESLHREFNTIMRAHKLTFQASSFEAAGSDADRLTGLIRDAKRTSGISSSYRNSVLDFSAEGKIMQFLRRDASRLADAQKSLKQGLVVVQGASSALKNHGFSIKHEGSARFLTKAGSPISNLLAAVKEDMAWLAKAHDAVLKGTAEITSASQQLAGGGANEADKVKNLRLFKEANDLETTAGFLLGNHSIVRTGAAPSDGLEVKKYERRNEFKFDQGAFNKMRHGEITASLGDSIKFQLKQFGWVTGMFAGMIIGGPIGVGVWAGSLAGGINGQKEAYNQNVNDSKVISVSPANELSAVISLALTLDKYTHFTFDEDAIMAHVDEAAKSNTAGNKTASKLGHALGNLGVLSEVVYEHAIYITTQLAVIVDQMGNDSN